MKISYKYIILHLIILITVYGCTKFNQSQKKPLLRTDRKIEIFCPDTVIKGKVFYGKIKYDSTIDSLDLSKILKRNINLYITTDQGILDLEDFENSNFIVFKDSVDNEVFPFKASIFDSGEKTLTGALEDVVYLKVKDSGKVRVLKETSLIFMQIFVKE